MCAALFSAASGLRRTAKTVLPDAEIRLEAAGKLQKALYITAFRFKRFLNEPEMP